MNKNLVEVGFVIDASGSMGHLRNDTIGGFNSVIESQKSQEGETRISAVVFNSNVKTVYENTPVDDIVPLNNDTYKTWGCTALYDAMGTLIDSIGKRLANTSEEERPGKVLVVVITDGEENASQKYTFADIKEKVEHQQTVYSWEFMFLGADMNSMNQARSMGFKSEYTKTYSTNTRGVCSVYNVIDSVVCASKAVSRGDIDDNEYMRSMACAMDQIDSGDVETTINDNLFTDVTSLGGSKCTADIL